jgi:hypothetical protein
MATVEVRKEKFGKPPRDYELYIQTQSFGWSKGGLTLDDLRDIRATLDQAIKDAEAEQAK